MKETVPDFEVPSTRGLREPILECSELSAFILSLACPPQVWSEWFEVVLELHKTEVRAVAKVPGGSATSWKRQRRTEDEEDMDHKT